jgi:membrane-associated phospholipid phosphatase
VRDEPGGSLRQITHTAAALILCATALPASAQQEPRFDDGRRTLGRFAPNLGRSFIGVFQPDSLRPLALGGAAALASSRLDGSTERFFTRRWSGDELGEIGQTAGGAKLIVPLTAAFFVAGRASQDSRFRAATYDALQATIVNQSYATALKLTVRRTRPDGSNDLSFPSGHTSNAFALATVVGHHYGKRAGITAFVAAGLIGVSRLERNVHHLSDVVAGAALGYAVGRSVVRENGEPAGRGARLALVPSPAPSGGGVGLGVALEF